MTEMKIDSFNIEPLVFEIENVVKNGLKVLLKDYIDRHDLLEKTHKQIMKLPSVMNEINKCYDSDSEDENSVEDKTMFVSITDMTRDLVKKEISYVENKLDRIEKKYESITPLISKILDKLELINDEVKVLKENPKDNIKIVQMEHTKPCIYNVIKPSIVSACENENIKFEINEDECDEDECHENDCDENDEVEVVELIKVKKEVIVIKDEEVDNEEGAEEEAEEEEGAEEEAQEEEEAEEEDEAEEEVEEVEEAEEEEVDEEDKVETEASDEEEEEDKVETEASDEEEEEEEEEVVLNPPTKEEEVKLNPPTKEDEEDELEIVTIDDIDYCTNNLENGFIWELSEDGEQGDKIGYLKQGEPFFYADEK